MTNNRDILRMDYYKALNEISYFQRSDEQSKLVCSLCRNIINSILMATSPDKLLSINPSRMSKFANSNDETNVKLAIYFLSLPPINLIDWVYEANDIFSDCPSLYDVMELDSTYISNANNKQEFTNPFNGEEITKEQFERMINVVFKVSDDFVNKYRQVKV